MAEIAWLNFTMHVSDVRSFRKVIGSLENNILFSLFCFLLESYRYSVSVQELNNEDMYCAT